MTVATAAAPGPGSRCATTRRCGPSSSEHLGLPNIMLVPRLEKIVVNMGVGRATQQPSLIEGAVRDLEIITGQKPVVTRARQSIAGFKLREGMPIGAKVTLRGDRMWEFFDRLIAWPSPGSVTSGACRRSRSTAGATTPSGSPSSSSSPRSTTTSVDTTRGMDITIVTTARNDAEGRALLDAFGFPFRAGDRLDPMAKKALIEKQQRTPKFKVRAYTRCRRCGRPRGRVPQVRPVPHLPARDGARRRRSPA